MKHQPVIIAKILEERFDLRAGKTLKPRTYWAAYWKSHKADCGHAHRTERAARPCLRHMKQSRKNWIALEHRIAVRSQSWPRLSR
jgi:hypothetical protein